MDAWLGTSSVVVIGESTNHWSLMKASLSVGKIQGPLVHDARIAVICEAHGVTEFLTARQGFQPFPFARYAQSADMTWSAAQPGIEVSAGPLRAFQIPIGYLYSGFNALYRNGRLLSIR